MGFRFRKSIKIAPGLRVNISKSGLSTSVGRRGATVNFSKRGTRITAGIPGTGISASKLYRKAPARQKLSPPKHQYIGTMVLAMLVSGVVMFVASGTTQGVSVLVFIGCVVVLWRQVATRVPSDSEPIHSSAHTANVAPVLQEHSHRVLQGHTLGPSSTAPLERQPPTMSAATPATDLRLDPRMVPRPQASVNGLPTYKLLDQKDNLAVMDACAQAESDTYWAQPQGTRSCAAPFYFERAAILYRKEKKYDKEIQVCEAWIAIANDYAKQSLTQAASVHLGARSQAIFTRVDKAIALRSKAESKS